MEANGAVGKGSEVSFSGGFPRSYRASLQYIGPEPLKPYLPTITKALAYALESSNHLAMCAAGVCVDELRRVFGHAVFNSACEPASLQTIAKSPFIETNQLSKYFTFEEN